jgi:hypothetical protein
MAACAAEGDEASAEAPADSLFIADEAGARTLWAEPHATTNKDGREAIPKSVRVMCSELPRPEQPGQIPGASPREDAARW